MAELLVDFITSLDGYASGDGWPGFWGLEGPEYMAWLGEQPSVTYLMGATTYRLMSGFAGGEVPEGQEDFSEHEAGSVDQLTAAPKITGRTGSERIYDGCPDLALEMTESRTFDGRIQLVEYRPTVLDHPPLHTAG